jgi:hypothetical protein
VPDLADLRLRRIPDAGVLPGTIITAAVSGVAVVDIGTAQISVNVLRGLTPAVGDVVLVARRGSSRWLIGILGTAAPAAPVEVNDAPPPPVPVVQTGTSVFKPTSTGSYRSGKWRTDTDNVIQGYWAYSTQAENKGAAFYGRGPNSLSGATCTKVTVKLRRVKAGEYGGRRPTLRLISTSTRSGSPSFGSSTTGPSMAVDTSTTFTLPTSWGQALIDGTAGGIGIDAGGRDPYIVLNGRSSWSSAFVLSISWKRTT